MQLLGKKVDENVPKRAISDAIQVVLEILRPLNPTKTGTIKTMIVPVKLPWAAVVVSKPKACKMYPATQKHGSFWARSRNLYLV